MTQPGVVSQLKDAVNTIWNVEESQEAGGGGMAPVSVRWNYWMDLYGGRAISLLQRQPFNRLAILDRPDA